MAERLSMSSLGKAAPPSTATTTDAADRDTGADESQRAADEGHAGRLGHAAGSGNGRRTGCAPDVSDRLARDRTRPRQTAQPAGQGRPAENRYGRPAHRGRPDPAW